jgi:hypothetical protein
MLFYNLVVGVIEECHLLFQESFEVNCLNLLSGSATSSKLMQL